MKEGNRHRSRMWGLVKDSVIILLIFSTFYFIDHKLAAFLVIITTTILLVRRIFHDYNPGFISGHHFTIGEKELTAPNGVDVFDLNHVPTMEHLLHYVETLRIIVAPPRVLAIRFCGIVQMEEYDIGLLAEIVRQLQKSDIAVIFSDVERRLRLQLTESGIEQQIGGDINICDNIEEALARAS